MIDAILIMTRECRFCADALYPTDATWLNDETIMVQYGGCPHLAESVAVVDLRRVRVRCSGLTRDGRPCQSWPRRGSDRCAAHGDRV